MTGLNLQPGRVVSLVWRPGLAHYHTEQDQKPDLCIWQIAKSSSNSVTNSWKHYANLGGLGYLKPLGGLPYLACEV